MNLETMWEESDPRTPMVCLLSMGSDPTASIEALSKKNRLGKLLLSLTKNDGTSGSERWCKGCRKKMYE